MFVRSIAESVRRYIESFAPASASITWASSEVTRSFKMITGQVEVEIFPKQGCGYPIFSGVECITCNNFGPDISGERDVITNVMKISHSPLNDLVQAPKHDPRNIAIIMIKYFIKLRKLWVKSYHLAALCNAKRYRSAQQHEFFHSVDATPFEPGRLIELPFQHFPGFDKSSALHWMSFLWCRVSLMRLSYRSLWLHPSPSHNKPAQVSSCDYIRKPKDKNDFFPTIEAAFQPFSDTVFRPLLERAWMHEMNDNDVKFYSRPADLDVMQRNPNVIGSNVLDACKL